VSDLKVGFDAEDIFGPHQIKRTILRRQFLRQCSPGQRCIARDQPTFGDFRACDGPAVSVGGKVSFRLQHHVQRHRQPR